MYQRARTVGYASLSGGALNRHSKRSARDIRREWAELDRKRKGHSTVRPDLPYDVPSYYSEKDRRRGKKHPGHMLLEERGYGPMARGPLTLKGHGQLGARRRGATARERSEYARRTAEPVEEFLSEARGPRHTRRWLGDFSDPAALRARRRQQRGADLAEAQGALGREPERPSVPQTIEAAPAVRGRPQWTSTGERQYFTQAEYKAAHRVVPYEHRQAKPLPGYGPQRGEKKLRWLPHESATGPRVTGSDRAIVPAGLSYEEREKRGREMVPFEPTVATFATEADVGLPVASAEAPIVPKKSDRRLAREAVQMPYDADQPKESTKRGDEDVDDALDYEPAQRQEFLPSSSERRPGPKAIAKANKAALAERGAFREDVDKEFAQLKRLSSRGTIFENQQQLAKSLQEQVPLSIQEKQRAVAPPAKLAKGTMVIPAPEVEAGLTPAQARAQRQAHEGSFFEGGPLRGRRQTPLDRASRQPYSRPERPAQDIDWADKDVPQAEEAPVPEESTKRAAEDVSTAHGMPVSYEWWQTEAGVPPSKQQDIRKPASRADLPTRLFEPKVGRASAEQGFHDIAAGDAGVQGYMPPATRVPSGGWKPTTTADAAQWSKHAMQNQAKRRASAAANMQALGPSEPFHFAGSGADHSNIDVSGLKFDFGANRRPQSSSFMDTVNEATADMPAHEAEILSSNALQATGHVGAEPSPLSDLMGDFLDPIQITVPPVRPPERPQTQADASMAPPAEEVGEKRPAPDDGMGDKRQDLHDEPEPIELEFADPMHLTFPSVPAVQPDVSPPGPALDPAKPIAMPEPKPAMPEPKPAMPEPKPAPKPVVPKPKPIELEFADPTHLTFPDQPVLQPAETSVAFPVESEDRPMLESREESAAFPMPSEPTRTLESREASAAAPHPSEPKRVLQPSSKSVSFRAPRAKAAPSRRQRPEEAPSGYRRIVPDYRPAGGPVGTQSVNVSAPATASAPVSSGQASGQASAAGTGALREIARALATKAKPKARKSGISAARKRYTDARKTKLASLRAHRDKLVREHKAKTKKMPKKERDAARREFRKKVDSQYKEQVKKYPPARGMKDVGSVLKLIKRVQGARFS